MKQKQHKPVVKAKEYRRAPGRKQILDYSYALPVLYLAVL